MERKGALNSVGLSVDLFQLKFTRVNSDCCFKAAFVYSGQRIRNTRNENQILQPFKQSVCVQANHMNFESIFVFQMNLIDF